MTEKTLFEYTDEDGDTIEVVAQPDDGARVMVGVGSTWAWVDADALRDALTEHLGTIGEPTPGGIYDAPHDGTSVSFDDCPGCIADRARAAARERVSSTTPSHVTPDGFVGTYSHEDADGDRLRVWDSSTEGETVVEVTSAGGAVMAALVPLQSLADDLAKRGARFAPDADALAAARSEGYTQGLSDGFDKGDAADEQGYRAGVEAGRAEAFGEFGEMAHAHAVEVLRSVLDATAARS